MALEQASECPATLAKLRSGPLGTLLEGFCDWLLEQLGDEYQRCRNHVLAILSNHNRARILRNPTIASALRVSLASFRLWML